MKETIEVVKNLVNDCSEDEQKALRTYFKSLFPHPLEKEWEIDSDTILSAISRSSDLTKRGVRGIIAEAVFMSDVIPTIKDLGWETIDISGDLSYDAHLQKGARSARIQIKLQRLEKHRPKLYYPKFYDQKSLYVVEVQKTRSGEKTIKEALPGSDEKLTAAKSITTSTRPYKFGDFDILAVNMHPSSHDWKSFRYCLSSSLLPRQKNPALIEIFQPVAANLNEAWTDSLATCLKWLEEGRKHLVLSELLHLPKFKLQSKSRKLKK
jgi:hypothetical protein